MRRAWFFHQLGQLSIHLGGIGEAAGVEIHAPQQAARTVRAGRQFQQRGAGLLQRRPIGQPLGQLRFAPQRRHRHQRAIQLRQPAQAGLVATAQQQIHQPEGRAGFAIGMPPHEGPQQRDRLIVGRTRTQCRRRGVHQLGIVGSLGHCLQQPLRFALGVTRHVFALRIQPCQQLLGGYRRRLAGRCGLDAHGQTVQQLRGATVLAQLGHVRTRKRQVPTRSPHRATLQGQPDRHLGRLDQDAMRTDLRVMIEHHLQAAAQIPGIALGLARHQHHHRT